MNTHTTTVSRGAKLRGKKPAAAAKKQSKPKPQKATRTAEQPQSEERPGGKQATLIELLRRPEGATLADLTAATGWQDHSVRGAISGALKKKLKLTISSEKIEGRGRVYRIV